jgi:hypothetical protein
VEIIPVCPKRKSQIQASLFGFQLGTPKHPFKKKIEKLFVWFSSGLIVKQFFLSSVVNHGL